MALPNHQFTSLPDPLQIYISSDLIMRQMIIPVLFSQPLKREAGAPTGGVPQKRCSAVHIQPAGKFLIAIGLCWELLTFSNISSRADWEIPTFLLAFEAEQKELCELAEG